jgi:hypothetical protein
MANYRCRFVVVSPIVKLNSDGCLLVPLPYLITTWPFGQLEWVRKFEIQHVQWKEIKYLNLPFGMFK